MYIIVVVVLIYCLLGAATAVFFSSLTKVDDLPISHYLLSGLSWPLSLFFFVKNLYYYLDHPEENKKDIAHRQERALAGRKKAGKF